MGVSVEYLARLEQGRDRHPSRQIISALADALRLSTNDQFQLRRFVKAARGIQFPPVEPPLSEVRLTIRMLLHRLEPAPAVVINRLTDVLAHTDGFARLMAPVGLLDRTPANLVRFALTDPRARTAYPDWAAIADARVAALQLAPHRADLHMNHLVDELTALAGTTFTSRAHAPSLTPERAGVEELRHPDAGELRLAFEALTLPDADDQQLHRLPAGRREHVGAPRWPTQDRAEPTATPASRGHRHRLGCQPLRQQPVAHAGGALARVGEDVGSHVEQRQHVVAVVGAGCVHDHRADTDQAL